MKKITLLLATLTISLLQLQGCKEDRPEPDFDLEAMKKREEYGSIMDDKRQWKIGSIESNLPREFEYIYFNADSEFFMDTLRSVSTDWLSQVPACTNDDPIVLHYLGSPDLYGVETTDMIGIDVFIGQGEKCSEYDNEIEFNAHANSVKKFEQYEVDLGTAHSRFYGYNSQSNDTEDKKELWTNFRTTPTEISYEVDKTYKGEVYHVKVTLVPF